MVMTNSLNRKVQKLEDAQCMRREMTLRSELMKSFLQQEARQEMAHAAQIDDVSLIDRLIDAGLTPQSLSALPLAPLAAVAWASGSVSEHERMAAMQPIFDSTMGGQWPAVKTFRGWLTDRPDRSLLTLWRDYTRERLSYLSTEEAESSIRLLHHQATQVALASGGVFGIGKICCEEQQILDFINEVLG